MLQKNFYDRLWNSDGSSKRGYFSNFATIIRLLGKIVKLLYGIRKQLDRIERKVNKIEEQIPEAQKF